VINYNKYRQIFPFLLSLIAGGAICQHTSHIETIHEVNVFHPGEVYSQSLNKNLSLSDSEILEDFHEKYLDRL